MRNTECGNVVSLSDTDEVKENKNTGNNNNNNNNSNSNSGSGACGIFIAIVCLVLEAIIFLFVLIGTPIDVFKTKSKAPPRTCYSMWGVKQCGAHKANPAGAIYKGFPSKAILNNMNGAAAFAIISIFVTLVSLVLTVLLVCKCIPKIIPAVVSILAFFTILIVWACQAGSYNKGTDYGSIFGIVITIKIKQYCNYAGSFGLFVTAWCLQAIEMILVFFA
uniref:G-amastin n=1 Tax=Angomonas deanei TaxID=59799 RepID=C6K3Q4_9TRYP|nr:g-amastin [Angomonas deanei]